MLRHHLNMGWRQMTKRKGYTLINVFGLATGLASCLLIGAYVQEERRYDRHNELSKQNPLYFNQAIQQIQKIWAT